ncbi:efflux RND transporter permease subunit [Paraburkholderia elongata]|uniref:MMPL family transporter n=1 Tax=Paraburkholderia elongata TaxID=2675747 RepID=A0A972SIW3_9BURK|nr:MMPL family transporter [Paraburkholderia elongata]NPT56397.1 MMPL family transporter [Paraburkholderia elongata]
MKADTNDSITRPVVRDLNEFDRASGIWLERIIFNNRPALLLVCVFATLFLGWHALHLRVNASFEKMLPSRHPYIQNYLEHQDALRGLGNVVRIVVENKRGNIFDKDYLAVLQKVNDTVYLIPGVDRSAMRGLWTTSLRWTEVTEEGYRGGPVMPDNFDGSPASLGQLRINIARAGVVGSYVANDLKSSMIVVPLLDSNPDTRKPLDYATFSRELKRKVLSLESPSVGVHIVGFAEIVGDLIDGLSQVMMFFGISAAIAGLFVFAFTRDLRSTLLLIGVSALAVVWLLGLMELLGYALDPYSILVPFLIFAIGLSHGAQKMNGIMQDIAQGTHRYVAARYTFRRLFLAGVTALLTNVVGFAVLMVIDIPVIHDLALTTSIGVTVLIFTKLILVPVLLSYLGVDEQAAARRLQAERAGEDRDWVARVWACLLHFTSSKWAQAAIAVSFAIGVSALGISQELKTGDLDPGAPELRSDSRYNRDDAYVKAHYRLSSDQFVVMLVTPPGQCNNYATLIELDRMGANLRQVDGVKGTASAADMVRLATAGQFEGNPKWLSIPRDANVLNTALADVLADHPEMVDQRCSVMPLIAYLGDHKADTLSRVVASAEAFGKAHSSPERQFVLAAGSAGIEAATNIVVEQAHHRMLALLYAAVVALCLITFRNWRAVIVALVPLLITSVLCEALMVVLGIGAKVATLPVIALGVGAGVDYALYLLSVQLNLQRAGVPLREAYMRSLRFTGRVVALVGLTMSAGVITWIWSPIKFQADMGILLTFMFLWNMVGALVLIPSLSYVLLRRLGERKREADQAPALSSTATDV